MPRTFEYVREIMDANAAAGGHFFDESAMRGFSCRVYPEVYPLPEEVGGAYFITSEKRRGEPRACSVRYASADGHVRTVGDFMAYNLRGARSAIDCLLADTRRALRLCPDPAPFIRAFTGDALATATRMEREPVDAPDKALPAPDAEPCDDCGSSGYAAFLCDGYGHPGVELQKCDACGRFPTDDAAALAFVRALEAGDRYAKRVARFMLKHGEPAEANPFETEAA